jgi:molybdopterin-containing oxidoreductase family iron-sulfur binding subunit
MPSVMPVTIKMDSDGTCVPPVVGGHENGTNRQYWRSLEEFAQTPEFLELVQNEFPALLDDVGTPQNRRTFLKLMGASLALAGFGLAQGCRRWPDEKIAPFAHRPEGYVPGTSVPFATSWDLGGYGHGLIARSYDGRPIKVEGNELHPINGGRVTAGGKEFAAGTTDAITQAQVLSFYDPDRSKYAVERSFESSAERVGVQGAPRTIDQFRTWARSHFDSMANARGSGLAILTGASSSPSFAHMKRRFSQAFPSAAWYEWEPLSRDNEIAGAEMAFGRGFRPQFNFANADVIVALDSDFLMSHPAALKHARDFAQRRRDPERGMSRLYAIEANLSVTGSNADHRLPVKSSEVFSKAAELMGSLEAHGVQISGGFADAGAWINALAADLASAQGRSIVIAGPNQPPAVHALAHAMNAALGNVGTTVTYTIEPEYERPPHVDSIRALTDAMRDGSVSTLLIMGCNPVYDAPADINFPEAIAGVPTSIHLGLYDDETAAKSNWHVPAQHFLEEWGTTRAWDGTIAPTQPIIEPLFGGFSWSGLLAFAANDPSDGYQIIRRWFDEEIGGDESAWRTMLHDGVLANSAWPVEAVAITSPPQPAAMSFASSPGYEVAFVQSASMYDGRFANNGWLQELPDPIGKFCWDNAAYMNPATAAKLGVGARDMVHIGTGGDNGPTLKMPVHVVPLLADDSITVHLGYGRWRAGNIGDSVGFNTFVLRTTSGMHFASADVEKAQGSYKLATVQDHHVMDAKTTREGLQERLPQIVREATLAQFMDNLEHGHGAFDAPGAHAHHLPIVSLWREGQFDNASHQWAMAIDLNACIGCSACMVACQAENNVPVVGKDQVMRGREMHWIRVDRYFRGEPEDADVVFQPVTCQHCENAPCEQVCPVAATTHDTEGLNVMVYNRCIGTRYCSNNCPYKVRRFNFYNWHFEDPRRDGLKPPALMIPDDQEVKAFDGAEALLKLGMNPEVTVRSRGVMEKCSFCVQRINRVKIDLKNQWMTDRDNGWPNVPDGAVTPACAGACPTQAIVFGDLKDADSRVAQMYRDARAYSLLEDLNTKPRNRFLGKVRNTNSAIPGATVSAGAGAHNGESTHAGEGEGH